MTTHPHGKHNLVVFFDVRSAKEFRIVSALIEAVGWPKDKSDEARCAAEEGAWMAARAYLEGEKAAL